MSEGTQHELRIRRAAADDAQAVASVLYESFAEYEASYTPEAFSFTVSTPEQILERMREGPVWVALENEKITGTVGAIAKGASLYVRGMGVVPSAREVGPAACSWSASKSSPPNKASNACPSARTLFSPAR